MKGGLFFLGACFLAYENGFSIPGIVVGPFEKGVSSDLGKVLFLTSVFFARE